MVASNWDQTIRRILADEGGNDDDPIDPGGRTSRGIIQREWDRFRQTHPGRPADVWQAPQADVISIYRNDYWDKSRGDDLPAGFDYTVTDACVNSGPGRSVPWAGKALGIAVKSINDVVAPANAAPDKVSLIQKYWRIRLSFLQSLRTWGHFGKGWGRRVANGEAAAVRMWLSVGAKMSDADARKRLDQESKKAKTSSSKAGTGAATTGAGSGVTIPTLDWAHMSTGGKVAIVLGAAFLFGLIVYFIHNYLIHSQRADAYAKA